MYCENCRVKLHRVTPLKTRDSIKEAILFSSKRPQSPQSLSLWATGVSNAIDKLLENARVYDINFDNLQKSVKGSEFHKYCLYLENLLNEEGIRIQDKLGIGCDLNDVPNKTNQRVIDYINKMEAGNETEEEGQEVLCGEVGNS